MQIHHVMAGLAAVGIAFACSTTTSPAQAQGAVEAPPVFRAADVLPPQLLKGSQYRVEDQVQNDGLMKHYRICSDFGTFEAHSNTELAKRVQEIGAIAKLKQVEEGRGRGRPRAMAGWNDQSARLQNARSARLEGL